MKRKRRKLLWIPILLLLAAAAAAAVYFWPEKEPTPIKVYSMSDLAGYNSWEGGTTTSYGSITTNRVQPVYLSSTQMVTEILVSEGQHVSKGDVLFTYDTTLSDLNLQKADLAIQQKKVDLKNAQDELAKIRKMKPIVYHPAPATTPTTKPVEEGKSPANPDNLSYIVFGGSGTEGSPAQCWTKKNLALTEKIMKELFDLKAPNGNTLYLVVQHSAGDAAEADITEKFGVVIRRENITSDVTVDVTEPTEPDPDDEEEEGSTGGSVNHQTVHGSYTRATYSVSFFEPKSGSSSSQDPSDSIDWNSGYTAAEIASMKAEKEQQIKELQFAIKMAEAEYKIMKKEADDGKVTAEFDGTVGAILDPDEALSMSEPIMKISGGGGGFYVEGTVSEMELNTISVGQPVTVVAYAWWEGGGGTFTGVITEIGDYPVENKDYYYGGSNVTYYPYKVFLDENAALRDGDYVEMTLGENVERQVLCINNAFLVNEGSFTFVYVRTEDGTLEKRQIQTRPGQWDGNTVVVSGLTSEDYVAFPYDKDVQVGAPTEEGTWETLYGQTMIG